MMNETEVMAEFQAAEAILHGHFILSSGLHSDTYLQCARALMDPARADRLCRALAQKIRATLPQLRIDAVISPAMGGVVVGYEMARQLNLPSMFCERQDGSFALRRGFAIAPGTQVLVVEDVVTTGKSSREAFACIEANGGVVVAEASLIDRSGGSAAESLGMPYVSLMALDVPTYAPDNLPAHLQQVPAIKPGSRWLKSA
jgi:orotate phosphoribosyltransferase